MKAGDFAKACNIPISVLRFYDSECLLKPAYIDKATGYRYYTESQKTVCARIGLLKSCGFTLAQIKQMLKCDDKKIIESFFVSRRKELENMLLCLDETQEIIMNSKNNIFPHKENIKLIFKNDEAIIGKWEVLKGDAIPQTKNHEVYFLPNGEG